MYITNNKGEISPGYFDIVNVEFFVAGSFTPRVEGILQLKTTDPNNIQFLLDAGKLVENIIFYKDGYNYNFYGCFLKEYSVDSYLVADLTLSFDYFKKIEDVKSIRKEKLKRINNIQEWEDQ